MSRPAARGIAAAGALALVLSTTPASARAPQTVGIRPVDIPANQADDPRAQFYIVDHVAPGAMLRRQVEVSNDTAAPRAIALYTAAASIGGGEFRLGDAGAANELTGWTSVTPSAVRLAAGDKGEATVTITVPSAATPGERYGVVWAAVAASSSAGSGILEINRVGVRIYLSVGPGAEPPTDFEITSLAPGQASDGGPAVSALVRNTGGRAVDLSGGLSLRRGPAGRAVGPLAAQLGATLGPGEAEPVLVPLNRPLPGGEWDASMVLRSGSTERSASARLTLPRVRWSISGQAHALAAPRHDRGLPLALGAVGVLVLLFIRVGRRRNRHAAESDQRADL